MTDQMNNHRPIEPEAHQVMNMLAQFVDEALNGEAPVRHGLRKWGFALLVFNLSDSADKRANYICNCRRDDMLAAMKEFIARNEGRFPESGKQQ